MNILGLSVKNLLGIKIVELNPDGKTVVIGGKNGAGKSSLLNAVLYAFGGKSAIAAVPIRDGEDSAEVVVKTKLLTIKRTWTKEKTYLTVTAADGAKYGKGQTVLDSLLADFGADLTNLLNVPPKKQALAVAKSCGLLEELEANAAGRAAMADRRKVANAEVKRLGAQPVEELAEKPLELVDVSALATTLEEAIAKKARNDKRREERQASREWLEQFNEKHKQDVEVAADDIANLQARLEQHIKDKEDLITSYEADLHAYKEGQESFDEEIAALVDPETDNIRDLIAGADQSNELYRKHQTQESNRSILRTATKKAGDIDEQVKRLDTERKAIIAKADLLEGLEISADHGLTYNDLPFEQLSQAERLKISVFIATKINPKLKVLLMRDGSLLDEDSLASVRACAEEHGFQLWIERVGAGEEPTVVIEEGEVLNTDPDFEVKD